MAEEKPKRKRKSESSKGGGAFAKSKGQTVITVVIDSAIRDQARIAAVISGKRSMAEWIRGLIDDELKRLK